MQLEDATILELQQAMVTGQFTAHQLTKMYIERISTIDQSGPTINAIQEINPDALMIAKQLDRERQEQGPRGPLHGIPLLLKDNIATADQMQTTAGSLALLGSRPPRDAFIAQKLREAGAIILGKTNMSEWAASLTGLSERGGQSLNPYVLDHSPSGSSSGSATAVSANLAVASLGTETSGSILSPSSVNGIVGIKPTVGLTSRAGVIPYAHSQDTVGPLARTVADAAALLGAITGIDPRDRATQASSGKFCHDYRQFLDVDGLQGARIGVPREQYFDHSTKGDIIINAAINALRDQGAEIIDPANIPTAKQIAFSQTRKIVKAYEFKAGLNAYLRELTSTPVHTLEEIIAFREAHTKQDFSYLEQQDFFLQAQATTSLKDPVYLEALAENQRLSRQEGIDFVMDQHHLDALVMPTENPAWPINLANSDQYSSGNSRLAAIAGYPAITVPAGFAFELPVGITFIGRAFSEPMLIKLAYAFEQATHARRPPHYLPTMPLAPHNRT